MKKRSEMNPAYMWDFTHIFKTHADWEAAYARTDELIAGVAKAQGTLGDSADSLYAACEAMNEAGKLLEIVAIYAMLHKSADSGDADNQDMDARTNSLMVRFGSAVSYFNPEILAIDPEKLEEYLKDPRMADYRFMINDITRARAHILDSQREKMLAMLSDVRTTPKDTYEMLTDVEMRCPDIIGENGEHHQLTHGNFKVYRESPDRRIREQAFENFFGTYKSFINTTASLYAGSVKMDHYMAQMRGFDSVVEQSLFDGNIPVSVYDSLVGAMHDSLPIMRKYLELRKKALNRPDLDMFDLYTPMLPDVDFAMPIEEGKKLVKKALKPLSAAP